MCLTAPARLLRNTESLSAKIDEGLTLREMARSLRKGAKRMKTNSNAVMEERLFRSRKSLSPKLRRKLLCKFEADNPVESGFKTDSADCGEQLFPGQRVMIEATSYSIEFDRGRNATHNTGRKAEEGTKTDAVTDAEDNRVRHGPR
jgi:hypothetical protein